MGWTIAWGVLRAIATLALAALLTTKATNDFEAAAFIAGLIAYHRIGFGLGGESVAAAKRAIRTEIWFHRLNALIPIPAEAYERLTPLLRDVDLGQWSILSDLADELKLLEKKHFAHQIIQSVVEVLLILALLAVILR